jgi:hypothetical protein
VTSIHPFSTELPTVARCARRDGSTTIDDTATICRLLVTDTCQCARCNEKDGAQNLFHTVECGEKNNQPVLLSCHRTSA